MTTATPAAENTRSARIVPPSPWRRFVSQNKLGTFGIVVLVAILALSFIGPFFLPDKNPTRVDLVYCSPSADAWLGCDNRGRDILYQIVNGGAQLILVSAAVALLSTLIAITFGALAALIGGKFESIVLMVTEVVLTVPSIILLAVLAAFVKLNSAWLLVLILAATGWPTLLRAVRAQVLSLKEREFVEAARMLDLGLPRILFREVLPNMASYILINFVFAMTGAIYGQVVLYFLGLVSLSGDNWGLMVDQAYRQGAAYSPDGIMYLLSPIVMIVLLMWSLTLVARALEDVFNPRLREA